MCCAQINFWYPGTTIPLRLLHNLLFKSLFTVCGFMVERCLRAHSARRGERLHSCCCGFVADNERPLRGALCNPHKSYMWSQRVTQLARSHVQSPRRGHQGGGNWKIKLRKQSIYFTSILRKGTLRRRQRGVQQSMNSLFWAKGESFCLFPFLTSGQCWGCRHQRVPE